MRSSSLLLAIAACGTTATRTAPLTAVVLGAHAGDVRAALSRPIEGVAFAVVTLPESLGAAPITDEHGDEIARARRAYINADFPSCRALLDPIDTLALLDGHREIAARVLVWRVACRVGEGDKTGARRDAMSIAVAGLALPADIASVTPDVELLIGDVTAKLAANAPVPLRVTARPAGARVSVDGRDDSCVTPCTVRLAPGAHALTIAADGFTPMARRILTPDDRELAIELVEAAPPIIAAQLQLRVARGAPVDDPSTLALAARAVRARQLIVLGVAGTHLVGALYADGQVGARGERVFGRGGVSRATAEVTRELLGTGGIVPATPLWRRPRFWISVVVASAITAGITGYLVFRPDPQSKVVFP
ncbi:MAG: hypothetical protein H6Q90_4062 [Deltaproteobacteria bacterium]|nr:hypothetical protein [Deltaproteobacteria bacterium]